MERGTKFEERIKIDEDKELEYFHVPAHNGLTEADFLYDFKNVSVCLFMGNGRYIQAETQTNSFIFLFYQRLTVMRIKRDSKCYVSPLPDSLPSPSLLKAGLQMVLIYKNSQSPLFWFFPFLFPQ